jgi:hypothetical protein
MDGLWTDAIWSTLASGDLSPGAEAGRTAFEVELVTAKEKVHRPMGMPTSPTAPTSG